MTLDSTTGSPASGVTDAPARQLLPTATAQQTRRAVGELLRLRRGAAVLALLVVAVATAAGVGVAPVLGHVVDLVVDQRETSSLAWPIVLLALLAAIQAVTTAVGLTLMARVSEGMLAALRERFVERALGMPLERVEDAGSGDLTSRVTNDVSMVAEGAREALPALVRSSLTIVLTFVGLALLDWRFLLAALLAVPIQVWTVRWYVREAVPLYARQRIAVGAQQQQLVDTVGGATTVRAFRLGDQHLGLVRGRSQAAVDLVVDGQKLATRFFGRLNVAEYVGVAGVLIVGFVLVRDGRVTLGVATAAALYFHNLFTPINIALALVDEAQKATASLARLVGVAQLPDAALHDAHDAGHDGALDTGLDVPAARAPSADAPAPAPSSAIAVDGVSHAYVAGNDVLHDVTLAVPAGATVALVGASGAGKTTLAKIIKGVHQPTAGTVTIGGVDVTDLDAAALRKTVFLVTQEVHVFAGPLADDLRLARPDADDAALLDALTTVGARDWAEALPDALATVVGEGGHKLTAAQSQQLALARLVLAAPPVAILDEATAEAGSAGARVLEAAAANALAGRTAIVVAHRLTQASTADLVVLLDEGRVVETGTHEELSARDGRYAALWDAWTRSRHHAPEPQPQPTG